MSSHVEETERDQLEKHMVPPAHFFTVDVEEYYQVSALEPYVPRGAWSAQESRVELGTDRLLQLMEAHDVRGTFFTLGLVAERHPALVRRVVSAGHEVASHGWDHRRVTDQAPGLFRTSVRRTKQLLEDLTGEPVTGYRAPSYSIVGGREWALDILLEEGYRYDSSLFPVRRWGSGYPAGGRDPHWLDRPAGRLLEFPPATLRRLGWNLPAGGGAYFRLLPYGLVRGALRDAGRRGVPATFYIHPWEVDPDQPRFAVPPLTRVRHYGGLARTASRLVRLLSEFRFGSIREGMAYVERPAA